MKLYYLLLFIPCYKLYKDISNRTYILTKKNQQPIKGSKIKS